MTITLCNSHPFTFYLPFHTSLRADQCPIQSHVPSTCTLGLDPCARNSLITSTTSTPPAALSALPQHLPPPFSVIVLSSQYLFQRGPIWMYVSLFSLSATVYRGKLQSQHSIEHLTWSDPTWPSLLAFFLVKFSLGKYLK